MTDVKKNDKYKFDELSRCIILGVSPASPEAASWD